MFHGNPLLQEPKQGRLSLFLLPRRLENPSSSSSPLPCLRRRLRERWRSLCVRSGRSGCGRCGGRSRSPTTTRRRPPRWPRRPPPSRPPSSPSACTRRTRRPSTPQLPQPLPPPPTGPRPWVSPLLPCRSTAVWSVLLHLGGGIVSASVCLNQRVSCLST